MKNLKITMYYDDDDYADECAYQRRIDRANRRRHIPLYLQESDILDDEPEPEEESKEDEDGTDHD